MKVKILPDTLSSHMTGGWLKHKLGDKYDPDDESLLDPVIGWSRKMIAPVFNRPGWYCTKDMCWLEMRLPSGRLVAAIDSRGKQYFDYSLKMLNSEEKPIPDDVWETLLSLIARKHLRWTEEYRMEASRRRAVISRIGMRKHLLRFKKKIKAAKQEASNNAPKT